MTTITFDKLVYLETLKASGISEDHARAHAHALDEALRDSVATKADVRAELEPVKLELAAVKAGTGHGEVDGRRHRLRCVVAGA